MAIVTVSPSPTGTPLADAVSAASPGDIILVNDGSYPEGTVTVSTNNLRIIAKHEGQAVRLGANSAVSAFVVNAEKGVVITGFRIQDYTGDAVSVTAGDSHRIIANTIVNAGGNGIDLLSGKWHLVWRNNVRQAAGIAAIHVASDKSLIAQNEARQNTGDGILISGSNNIAVGNTLSENGSAGIVDTGTDNLLFGNTNTPDTTISVILSAVLSKLMEIGLNEGNVPDGESGEGDMDETLPANEEAAEGAADEPAEAPAPAEEPAEVPAEVPAEIPAEEPAENDASDSADHEETQSPGSKSDPGLTFKIPHIGTFHTDSGLVELLMSTLEKIRSN